MPGGGRAEQQGPTRLQQAVEEWRLRSAAAEYQSEKEKRRRSQAQPIPTERRQWFVADQVHWTPLAAKSNSRPHEQQLGAAWRPPSSIRKLPSLGRDATAAFRG